MWLESALWHKIDFVDSEKKILVSSFESKLLVKWVREKKMDFSICSLSCISELCLVQEDFAGRLAKAKSLASSAGSLGSIPGPGIKIPHTS